MKIQGSLLVFFSLLDVSFAAIDAKACKDCDDTIEDARVCINTCDEITEDESFDSDKFTSLFDYCYLDKSGKKVKKLKDLVSCCKMEKDCENTLEDLDGCLNDCFDPCLRETAKAYKDCLQDRNCDYSCFRESDGGIDFTELADLTPEDAKCDDLEKDYYEGFCKIGKNCCSKCTTEQASVLDCVFNKNVIPYLNSTLPAETASPTAAPVATVTGDSSPAETPAPVDSSMSFPTDAPAAATPAQRQLMSSKWDGEYLYECPVDSDCKYRRLSGVVDEHPVPVRALATDGDDEDNCADVMATAYAQGNITTAAAAYMECVFSEDSDLQGDGEGSGAVILATFRVLTASLVVGGVTFWTLFN